MKNLKQYHKENLQLLHNASYSSLCCEDHPIQIKCIILIILVYYYTLLQLFLQRKKECHHIYV